MPRDGGTSTDQLLLATLVRRVHLAIRRRVHAELVEQGFDDLTPAHVYLFQSPGPDGLRPSELAARTNMTKQAMNHLLASLEAAGYVTRAAAPDDGRARVLRLTPRGRAVVRVMTASAARIERECADRLGDRRVDGLRRTLAEIDALLAREGSAASA